MAQKRIATTDLNHDNWDAEEEPETSGIFKSASSAVLAGRQIKQATRRLKKSGSSVEKQSIFKTLNLTSSRSISSSISSSTGESFSSGLVLPGSSTSIYGSRDTKSSEAKAKTSEFVSSKIEESTKSSEAKAKTSAFASSEIEESPKSVDTTEENGTSSSSTCGIKAPRPFATLPLSLPGLAQSKDIIPLAQNLKSSSPFSTSKSSNVTSKKVSADNSDNAAMSINSAEVESANDSHAFSIKPFTNFSNHQLVSSEPGTSAASPQPLQVKLKTNDWPTPLKCLETTETVNEMDSRYLLKPVPEDVTKQLQAKAAATGKSLHFLQRIYQLNMTFLDWTSLLVQQDLTINIAEIIPSYLDELIKLMNEEITSQKSENAECDLYSHHVVLQKMVEVFKLFGIGTNDSPLTKSWTLAKKQDSVRKEVQFVNVSPLTTENSSHDAELKTALTNQSVQTHAIGFSELSTLRWLINEQQEMFQKLDRKLDNLQCSNRTMYSSMFLDDDPTRVDSTQSSPVLTTTTEESLLPFSSQSSSCRSDSLSSSIKSDSGDMHFSTMDAAKSLASLSDGSQAARSEDQRPSNADGDADDEPPKAIFTPIIEEGATCTMRCKVFIKRCNPRKTNSSYIDHGVGTLSIKPITKGKVQLVVRAENTLGNVVLNACITSDIPIQMANPTTVMLVCCPLPSDADPKTILLRVKTNDEAKLLHEKLTVL